jgi:hypothetical protein
VGPRTSLDQQTTNIENNQSKFTNNLIANLEEGNDGTLVQLRTLFPLVPILARAMFSLNK